MEDIRKGVCPLCSHNEVIEAPVFDLSPLTGPLDGQVRWQGAFPAGLTYSAGQSRQAVVVHGALSRYACRSCGFTQTFVASPVDVPIGPDYRTRLLKGPEPAGPNC